MCRSRNEPDGPRTCPSDTRADYAAVTHVRDELEAELASTTARLQPTPRERDSRRDILRRAGLSTAGKQSVEDYSIIHDRDGDLHAWGFTSSPGGPLQTSDIDRISDLTEPFVTSLSPDQRSALATYTTGMYVPINAAYVGENPTPTSRVEKALTHLDATFAAHRTYEDTPPVNVVRGTGIPADWPGGTEDYLAHTFTPGTQLSTEKITSLSSNPGVATRWARQPPLIMVVQTTRALSVRSLADHRSEDEVILAPHSRLRCVRADRHGIDGHPTVYLVDEELVADAQKGTTPTPVPSTPIEPAAPSTSPNPTTPHDVDDPPAVATYDPMIPAPSISI